MNGSKVDGAGCGDAKHSATKGKKNTRGVGEKEGPPGRRDTYKSRPSRSDTRGRLDSLGFVKLEVIPPLLEALCGGSLGRWLCLLMQR